ncbi:rab GTPase-activating protein 1 isoform X12 [Ostrinia furnacalis]|uniref:rab GTPase-activating protein 1 isoform X12 n=1 Tax=Ostrinia furnacalis TaxID=93504 RepID=UPI00103D1E44|nr:rab GTPase-activating protein 1 isoform X12 [Ostrinia furnacalis]
MSEVAGSISAQYPTVMEFTEIRTNEVEPIRIDLYADDRSRTPSPAPVLTSNVCCDLEDLISEAISESLSSSLRISRSQLINQELTIRPEANIESNVPDGLDLFNIIFEVESDSEARMGDIDDAALLNNPTKEQDSCRLVGGSKFYEVMDGSASADASTPSPTEKHDHMKPIESDDEGIRILSDVDQECTVFSGVSYLGAQNISDPKSESDIQRIMKELSSMPESRDGIAVSISIPVCSQGLVVLYQADSNSVMTRYAVNRISFYARGATGSPVASCFAFTWSHGETKESAVYRCHVFRCHIAEAVNQVSSCFAKAFERIPRSMASSLVGELSAAPSMTGSLTEALGAPAPPMQLMHVLECTVDIKETDAKVVTASGELNYEVINVDTSGELDRSRLNLPLSLSSLLPSPLSAAPAPPSPSEPDSDGDEPLLSGTGEVSKDCGEDVLVNWAQVLRSWTGPRPRALNHLVRVGVPEALRGEVWLRLAGVDQNDKLMETYRTLISKDCPFEAVIQRDIARTFPAHDFFREAGGLGQDSLLRMARAYAVHDHEVGYCQGLSFLAATLLLHMPEEQAFCLLVRLMYGYGLRELYKDGFEALYMRLHQLDRLMEEQLPDLRAHFQELGVEPHMFASQWFLTVFTARFPLPLVYHILDVFLLQGIDTLFQVALALLSRSRKDLLTHDFEGVLKYFRVTLPKKCRAEESSRQIIKLACSIKVKRLAKYQQEYEKFVKETTEKEKINVELERLKMINTQLQQDKEGLETQLNEARGSLVEAKKDTAHYAAVAHDYREICARLDKQLHQVQDYVKDCVNCSVKFAQKDKDNKDESEEKAEDKEGSSDAEARLRQRVRDLELELAQVKLAHVQAQCSNQELSHQLNAALNELQALMNQKQSVAPWLVRTLGSIMEAAQNRPSFQTYLPNMNQETSSLHRQGSFSNSHSSQSTSQPSLDRRVSEPYSPDVVRRKKDLNAKRHSMLVDSNVTKEAKELNRRSHDATVVKNLSMG